MGTHVTSSSTVEVYIRRLPNPIYQFGLLVTLASALSLTDTTINITFYIWFMCRILVLPGLKQFTTPIKWAGGRTNHYVDLLDEAPDIRFSNIYAA
jgi:hypothetical protein